MLRQLFLLLLPSLMIMWGAIGGTYPSLGSIIVLYGLSLIGLVSEALLAKNRKTGVSPLLHFLPLCVLIWTSQLLLTQGPSMTSGQFGGPFVSNSDRADVDTRGKDLRPVLGGGKEAEADKEDDMRGDAASAPRTGRDLRPVHIDDGVFGGVLPDETESGQGRKMQTISVVLPCAEERQNALETVERFCHRTPADNLHEIIVVDDGSNPPLQTLFQSDTRRLDLDPQCKVRFLRHELTTGLMAAKLTGGKFATGDVLAFIDCHCAPQLNWHREILEQVSLNPRRMVVPAITDLDLNTFDEKVNTAVNVKCYLTLDANFKWFDDESDFIPTISGGLVAMGRSWFNLTGGFDEEMHGWGGENLDQSLRAWLCGGDIVRAKSSRVAHMWRTGDARTAIRYSMKARATNNRGRVIAAWYGPFASVTRGAVDLDEVTNYDEFKKRLGCRPLSYFFYRFRKLYFEGGVIADEVFKLKEVSTGSCLMAWPNGALSSCTGGTEFQLGNVDSNTGKCCSGIRIHGTNDCLDYFDQQGPHPYSCDTMGRNQNQLYKIRKDGRIQKGSQCIAAQNHRVILKSCADLAENEGVFERFAPHPSQEFDIYQKELQTYRWDKRFPNLPDD
eukprot:TRINITY_DN33417_c0_g1_i1.p1 TRINITY_DN33417_c0_g1~~TRINITY_DN33417_c0_g1_i1.p1  ORF type:complete len:615 (-),score=81.40 TRINITY_DN33417_c0_g1_i1:18-1862(-)